MNIPSIAIASQSKARFNFESGENEGSGAVISALIRVLSCFTCDLLKPITIRLWQLPEKTKK
jgi:hypothetical protein